MLPLRLFIAGQDALPGTRGARPTVKSTPSGGACAPGVWSSSEALLGLAENWWLLAEVEGDLHGAAPTGLGGVAEGLFVLR
ncbi:MAG: hypothetical protein ACI88C_002724 [Acidimicrobiales bacterium]